MNTLAPALLGSCIRAVKTCWSLTCSRRDFKTFLAFHPNSRKVAHRLDACTIAFPDTADRRAAVQTSHATEAVVAHDASLHGLLARQGHSLRRARRRARKGETYSMKTSKRCCTDSGRSLPSPPQSHSAPTFTFPSSPSRTAPSRSAFPTLSWNTPGTSMSCRGTSSMRLGKRSTITIQ